MKIFVGKVLSKKMQKTATVAVERTIIHPVYKKRYKRIKKYHVHDDFDVEVGSTVKFVASKPYSKLVKWKVVKDQDQDKKVKSSKKVLVSRSTRKDKVK